MGDFLENLLSYAIIGAMFLGLAFCLVLIVFLFFAAGVWLGAFCGYLLSFTPMGLWVRSALSAFGIGMSLRNFGALLGFICSITNIRLVNPVIAPILSWFRKFVGVKDD